MTDRSMRETNPYAQDGKSITYSSQLMSSRIP
ncbi:hypothetical protein CGRA01v4_01060 [Colletotrichum graminicola]|nr:hypothetical protein CGRA01v4_01060 [Colletotrichum graminicola]